jgi:two-component system chemotaxis response regulator CheB
MKILIVDDSIVFRTAITQALADVPDVEVKRKLSNGKLAVDYVRSNPDIDLITMDVEMPDMDGLEATRQIREFNKNVKILIFSGGSESGAEKTIGALDMGANDFISKTKGGSSIDESVEMIKQELVPRIRSIVSRGIRQNAQTQKEESTASSTYEAPSLDKVLGSIKGKPDLICIGSSTGGPQALMNIFRGLNHKITIPMVIIQHMPPVFTSRMATSLSSLSEVVVKEARDADVLTPGVCYIAPGDYHLVVQKDQTLKINQSEKVCYVRPSVDVFLNSVTENFRGRSLTIILTGMGYDGANGCSSLAKRGEMVLAQDELSSIVWGMPGAVCKNGSAKYALPLEYFPQVINKLSDRNNV